jgi:threonine/homoserine/homoserine lactone efflux protein
VGEAVGEVLAFGVGVAVSPLAVIAVVVMLDARNGRAAGVAFLAAWAAGLAGVGTLAVLLADGADASDAGAPATWVSVLKLVIAALLLVVAARQWRGRPAAGERPELPGWMTGLDGITPRRSAGLALVFACVKPKNLLLTIGAALAVAQTGADPGAQAAALVVFVLLGSLAPGVPVAIHVALRERGAATLTAMRGWMERENATVIVVLCVVLAAKLAVDGVSALAG